ncbi:MAG: hypothetical protein LUH10_14835 [Tannerellaceae bacterium]|nr:hypothetical protein [Tannerellaceae bacterium]
MKKGVCICLVTGIFLSACTWSMKKKIEEADEVKEELKEPYYEEDVTSPQISALEDVSVNPKIVRPDIVDNKASIDIFKDENQIIEVQLVSMGYTRIHAALTSHDTQANLRFSEIIMPDDSSDGPFGRELDYELPRDGTYKLIIGENIMAGEPWSGDFTLDFEVFRD